MILSNNKRENLKCQPAQVCSVDNARTSKRPIDFVSTIGLLAILWHPSAPAPSIAQDATTTAAVAAVPNPLQSYCQGGVVVGDIAYFSADDRISEGPLRAPGFPRVLAFNVRTWLPVRSYPFAATYDSTPLVVQKRDGTWLVLAHEHENARTVAMNRDSAQVDWVSESNQPGNLFFGYSYFVQPDSSKLIFLACINGLHAMSSESGQEVWWHRCRGTGGVTPCVDQANGWTYYQCDGKLFKLSAATGDVLATVDVSEPHQCVSWNTVLVNDDYGDFVATYWHGAPQWDSAIRVYDQDLKTVWEKTGLPIGRKATLTYTDGKLIAGCGNHWDANYSGDEWKHVTAYEVQTGDTAWQCDLPLAARQYIANVPYLNGCLYAESQSFDSTTPSQLFRINAANGTLQETLTYRHGICSCAPSIIAHGMLLSGDVFGDHVIATRIAENSDCCWPGPFGDPQNNQMAAVKRRAAGKAVAMQEVGR